MQKNIKDKFWFHSLLSFPKPQSLKDYPLYNLEKYSRLLKNSYYWWDYTELTQDIAKVIDILPIKKIGEDTFACMYFNFRSVFRVFFFQ